MFPQMITAYPSTYRIFFIHTLKRFVRNPIFAVSREWSHQETINFLLGKLNELQSDGYYIHDTTSFLEFIIMIKIPDNRMVSLDVLFSNIPNSYRQGMINASHKRSKLRFRNLFSLI